jgi:hypothetical protein
MNHLQPIRNRRTALSLSAALLAITCLWQEIPRVEISGTPYSVAIRKDSSKQMHYYQILEDGEPVSEWRLLTGYMSETLSNPVVERAGNRAIVRWAAHPNEFVELDVVNRTIIADSNLSNPSVELRTR